MTIAFVDLNRVQGPVRIEVERAIRSVLVGDCFVLGKEVAAFEQQFAHYCGVGHAIGVGSGTDAITIALRAVGVGAGDEVITAAFTCVPTVAGIEATGATAVLVDVEPETYTLDPEALASAVTSRTRAIVPVHLYGQCADMGPILDFSRRHGLRVVEDAAQAHGAEYRGARAGAMGDAAAFSFYPTKNLGALGDAGAVVTSDAEIDARARLLRNYGKKDRDESVVRGCNSRLDTVQAAILSVKLSHLDEWNERRRDLASWYLTALHELELVLPVERRESRHVYHLFVVRSPDRDRFQDALRQAGVQTLVHYPRAIHHHPAYAALAPANRGLPVSERLAREVVSLPLYPQLDDAEAEGVATAAHAALAEPPVAGPHPSADIWGA